MAPKEMLMLHNYQVDNTADSLLDSVSHVQTTMAELHSTVDELLKSMADILRSMAEMKAAVLLQPTIPAPTTESQVTVYEDLFVTPAKQPIAVDITVDEKESCYTHLKKIQLEMPVFEGLNVYSWISRAERYFEIGNFTDTEKLRLVYLSVDGEALNWYNFWNRLQPFLDWKDLKSRLLNRFGDWQNGDAFERLLRLEQVGSVTDYLTQFEELASQISDMPSDYFRSYFLSGLKEEIRNKIPMFMPKGLDDMIRMAFILENRFRKEESNQVNNN